MKNKEADLTTLSIAQTNSWSLRTTVPMWIVKQFALTDGDRLRWKLEARDNKLAIVVEPVKSKK